MLRERVWLAGLVEYISSDPQSHVFLFPIFDSLSALRKMAPTKTPGRLDGPGAQYVDMTSAANEMDLLLDGGWDPSQSVPARDEVLLEPKEVHN